MYGEDFYTFPCGEPHFIHADWKKNEKLLEEEKVACVPGTAFGESGEGFIRISYAYSLDHIKEACDRIEHFISSRIK